MCLFLLLPESQDLGENNEATYTKKVAIMSMCIPLKNKPVTEFLILRTSFCFFSRDVHFMIMDLARHTHHSAWHSMHNAICGGAKYMDDYLKTLNEDRVKLSVIQGNKDQVVPVECSINIKMKVPNAKVNIIPNANHNTVILGREKEFTQTLEHIWTSSSANDIL